MHLDHSGMEILDDEECRALLRRSTIGRIVFTLQALPTVQPVNFVFDGELIVVKTSSASRLATAASDTIVAFEIDEIDADGDRGWSVVTVGPARRVTEPGEIARLSALPLRSWAPGERDQFIVVRPRLITGRRIPESVPLKVPRS
ncbi:pyridoxamine 5'-phosphate oxidase family protein [Actinomadura sp. NPDC049753]|uniref:pyridoxamine 5'-phosphate oxidase family protein n=1 Tax=Actinomadura sp. NPDC049753 TaxID=3154739 RepID=UPI003448092D